MINIKIMVNVKNIKNNNLKNIINKNKLDTK